MKAVITAAATRDIGVATGHTEASMGDVGAAPQSRSILVRRSMVECYATSQNGIEVTGSPISSCTSTRERGSR